MVVLSDKGWSVRDIAGALDTSKSAVSRALRRTPYRAAPEPDIDILVAAVWKEGMARTRTRMQPRPGDKFRNYSLSLNLMEDQARVFGPENP